jgi:hypothetical protein
LSWTADVFQKLNSGATFKFNIKHAFYLNDSFDKVNKVTINGDTLKLKLNKPFRFKNITYIPNTYYENTPSTVWEGPWIINRRQIGALTFYHFPIDTFQPKINTNIAFKVDSPEESKAVMLNVLNNVPGPAHDIVCLNAGAALYAADLASSIQEGITLAKAAITSGAAKNKLELFVKTTQALAHH